MPGGGGAGGKEVGRISIRVVPNLDRFREDLKAKLEEIENSMRAKVHVDVEVDAGAAKEKLRAEMAEMKAMTAKNLKVHVDVDVDRHRVRNMLSGIGSGAGRAGGGAGTFSGGARAGMGMLMDQTFLIVTAVVALLAPALALLATSLAALPALISAVALPIGAVALGMGGFKKALENVGLLGEGKKGKTQAGEELKKLQKSVSDEFERGLTPIFQQLVGLLPMLTQGFTGVARGIVADIQGLSDAFTKGNGPGMIQNIFRNVGEMLSQAAPAMNSFATGILNLASRVSNHLPGLSRFFDEWGSKFSGWVDKIAGDGTLDKAVSGLRPVLDSLMNFGAQMMKSGIQLMADPAMAGNIKTLFDGITNFVQQSLPALNQLFSGIADLIHMLHLDGPSKPLENPKPGAAGGPNPHAPGGPLNPFPAAPGSNGKFSWIAPPGNQLPPGQKPGFLDRVESGEEFKGILKELQGNKKTLKDHPDPGAFLTPIKDFFTKDIGGFFKKVWDSIGMGQAGAAPAPFNPGKPAAPAAPAPSADGGAAGGQAQAQAGAIQGAFAALPGQLQGVWGAISNGAKGAFTGLVQAAQTAVQQISAALAKLPGEVTKALSGMQAAGQAAGQALGTGMAAGIAASAGSAIAAAKALAQGVEAAATTHLQVKSPSRVFQGIGQNVSEGMGQGIDAGTGDAVSRARSLADQIANATNDGLGGINSKAVGQQIKQALAELTVQRDQLQAQVDALPKGDKAGKAGLRAQLNQIKQVRDQLNLERDQMKLGGGKDGGGDSMSEAAQMITSSLAKTIDAGKSFVMANVSQFEHDVGIGGNGAIPKIAEFGLGWGQQLLGKMVDGAFGVNGKGDKGGDTHFHVGSVDEALQADQTLKNRKSMQWKSR